MTGWGFLQWASHVLLPVVCLECWEGLPPPLSGPFCGACQRLLRPQRRARARRRVWVERTAAAFRYRPPAVSLLRAFKFERALCAGRAAGIWMAGRWPSFPFLKETDILVPVPLHWRRERERGFNQARILADWTARTAGVPVEELLVRKKATAPRSRIAPRLRTAIPDGVFQLNGSVKGKRVTLIDDVATTGGTLEACAKELWKGGAIRVQAYVFADGAGI